MLRRVSVYAAGLREAPDAYVTVDMGATSLEAAVDSSFTKANAAFRNYAIAGVLHMEHMADLARAAQREIVAGHAALLGPALGVAVQEAERHLLTLFERHRDEWETYLSSLDKSSFVRRWSAVS